MKRVLLSVLVLLAFLMAQRGLFLFFFWEKTSVSIPMMDFFRMIVMGFRFDAMVVGFMTLPLVLAFPWIQKMGNRIQFGYFGLSLALLLAIGLLDFFYFDKFHEKLNSNFFDLGLAWQLQFERSYLGLILIMIIFAGLALFGFQQIWNGQLFPPKKKELIVMIFLCVLMARGSLGPRHIDLEFRKVTSSEFLNKAIVPSAYALDQALRGRW